jgi:hypothetical protein
MQVKLFSSPYEILLVAALVRATRALEVRATEYGPSPSQHYFFSQMKDSE